MSAALEFSDAMIDERIKNLNFVLEISITSDNKEIDKRAVLENRLAPTQYQFIRL